MMTAIIIAIVILDAAVNWFVIEKLHHTVNHFAQGVIYGVMLSPLLFWFDWKTIAELGIFARLAFYDPLLNLLRGESLLYNGKKTPVPGRKQSLMDWLENKSGIPVIYFRIGYLVAFITTIIFI